MKIGVISDTHGYLDPAVFQLFAGVEHILHGGDVGPYSLIHQLEQIAPVTAVLGNTDSHELGLREVETVLLGGCSFFLRHIVEMGSLDTALLSHVRRAAARVVIFGHTHRPYQERQGGILFLNPGYAGRPRFQLQRSVALLRIEAESLEIEFLPL